MTMLRRRPAERLKVYLGGISLTVRSYARFSRNLCGGSPYAVREAAMNRALSSCPVCAGALSVSKLSCHSCGIRISGDFASCAFCATQPAHQEFLEIFVRHRGDLVAVSDALDISLPAARERLDAAIAGLPPVQAQAPPQPLQAAGRTPAAHEANRNRVLEMLDRGEITAEEATRRLREL
jgi:hypothetical protein